VGLLEYREPPAQYMLRKLIRIWCATRRRYSEPLWHSIVRHSTRTRKVVWLKHYGEPLGCSATISWYDEPLDDVLVSANRERSSVETIPPAAVLERSI
jgi:hypothetical protein